MAEDLRLVILAGQGWEVEGETDFCWLDHDAPGFRKAVAGLEVFLCIEDAMLLERGKVHGSYTGAPLPRDSRATRWPWRHIEAAVAS